MKKHTQDNIECWREVQNVEYSRAILGKSVTKETAKQHPLIEDCTFKYNKKKTFETTVENLHKV